MSKIIKQIGETEVLTTLCNGEQVYKFNVETGVSVDLNAKAIKNITKDFGNSSYLYFTVSE